MSLVDDNESHVVSQKNPVQISFHANLMQALAAKLDGDDVASEGVSSNCISLRERSDYYGGSIEFERADGCFNNY